MPHIEAAVERAVPLDNSLSDPSAAMAGSGTNLFAMLEEGLSTLKGADQPADRVKKFPSAYAGIESRTQRNALLVGKTFTSPGYITAFFPDCSPRPMGFIAR